MAAKFFARHFGLRLSPEQVVERISSNHWLQLRQQLAKIPSTSPWGQWLNWFLEDEMRRPIFPDSKLSQREYVQQLLGEERLDATEQAVRMEPGSASVYLRAAAVLQHLPESSRTGLAPDPKWYLGKASQLASEEGK